MEGNSKEGLLNVIIVQLNNKTFQASVEDGNSSHVDLLKEQQPEYDPSGALIYVIAVLCMYAFSIILMIRSSIKKSKHDNNVTKYMKGMDTLRKIEKRQQKYRTRMLMHNNKQLAQVLERKSSEKSFQGSIDAILEESESELASVGGSSTCDVIDSAPNTPKSITTTGEYKYPPVNNPNNEVNTAASKVNIIIQMDSEQQNNVIKTNPGDSEPGHFVATDDQAELTVIKTEAVTISECSEPVFV